VINSGGWKKWVMEKCRETLGKDQTGMLLGGERDVGKTNCESALYGARSSPKFRDAAEKTSQTRKKQRHDQKQKTLKKPSSDFCIVNVLREKRQKGKASSEGGFNRKRGKGKGGESAWDTRRDNNPRQEASQGTY